ncbi:class A sortase [Lapidilactobacillus gannanensis]|jgi:sortase A|uniref:Class A sortase n=1 Tax=Lapidilactobacillus gannanensis TaxID=2486002 RepID=A0ABW4BP38_9LACO|nr:class A sortase [Lapidilactobacillus gannanensis]MCH4056987.1 class A sortase [Lactobacillaceae bacterium]
MNNLLKWLTLPLLLTLLVTGIYYWSYQRLLTGQDQTQYQLTKKQIKHHLKQTSVSNSGQLKQAQLITDANTRDLLSARTQFQQLVATQGIGELSIPKVAIKLPIFSTPTMATLSAGVARYFPQRALDASGNQVLIAHNFDGADVLLQRINQLQRGDHLFITNQSKIYDYQVQQNQVVAQSQVSVLDNVQTTAQLTLIRCEGGAQTPWRRVVVGRLVAQRPITQRLSKIGLSVDTNNLTNETQLSVVQTNFEQLTIFVSSHVFNFSWLISLLGLLLLSWWFGISGYLRTNNDGSN